MLNLPTKLYRAAQVRELDRIAIEERGIPGITLMTRAGQAAFNVIQFNWPDITSIAVFCGSGNNAGDGYIVAHEALKAKIDIKVFSVTPTDKLKGDALSAFNEYTNAGGTVVDFHSVNNISADVVVDALLGTGLDRDVHGVYSEAIETINSMNAHVIALDIPSGLNADTGCVMGCAVKADYSVSFIGLKQGLFTGQAADHCGEILFSLLDVPDDIYQEVSCASELVQNFIFSRRSRCAHKGHYGHVLVIGGDKGYSGAVRMAAEAAARTGAGLVSVATRPEYAGLMNLSRPELMCHGAESATEISGLLERTSVIAIGPGLGKTDWAINLFNAAIGIQKPMVIDADALNILAESPVKSDQWILTPHPGEAARLLKCSVAEIQQDRFAAVSEIQQKFGGVIILKGAGTLIDDGIKIKISIAGNPGMASGGMGDVLTGIIAALIAQGFDLGDAAIIAVNIHGRAADRAAQDGERGLLAGDLMSHIRSLVNE